MATKKNIALAKNSKIAEGMKAYHERKRLEKARAEEIEQQMQQRVAAISSARDPYKMPFLRITPATVRSILDSTKSGLLNDWADFADWMLQSDSLITSLVKIRLNSVAGTNYRIQPTGDDPRAIAAAEFIRQQLRLIPEFQINLKRLLMGVFTGVSMSEILWSYDPLTDTMFVKEICPVQTRKIKIRLNPETSEGDAVQTPVTTGYGKWVYSYYNFGDNEYGEGIDTDMFPGKFIIHSPGEETLPHDRGLFRPISFNWFFKQSGMAYWAAGAEKSATPVLYATIPRATPAETRYALADQLNNLAGDASAVFDDDITVETLFPSPGGGDGVWKAFIDQQNAEITKLIIGGTLTVDTGGAGSYALGSVHERTREDLMKADANALAETICRDLFYWMLKNNVHKFDGVLPPLPKIIFEINAKQAQPIDQMCIDAGVVTVNDLRESRGLPQWTEEQGGNNIAKILSGDTGGAAFSMESAGNLGDASTHYVGKKEAKDKDIKLFLDPPDSLNTPITMTEEDEEDCK